LDEQLGLAEAFLGPRLAPNEKGVEQIRDMVERLMLDRSLLRVDDVAQALELKARALQRRFLRYVGVSPKWVIQRYRLHEAAELLKATCHGSCSNAHPRSLAELAASLGYADQAHFAREFKRVVGRSPLAYRKELER
jgi:AraC-like DNA-binding protein